MLRDAPALAVVLGGGVFVFVAAFARAFGTSPMQVGNLLSVVLALTLRETGPRPDGAFWAGVTFLGGSLWAVLLTAVIWRVQPFRPARAAIAASLHAMSLLAADMRAMVERPDADDAVLGPPCPTHRRAVRDRLEAAREAVLATVRYARAGQRPGGTKLASAGSRRPVVRRAYRGVRPARLVPRAAASARRPHAAADRRRPARAGARGHGRYHPATPRAWNARSPPSRWSAQRPGRAGAPGSPAATARRPRGHHRRAAARDALADARGRIACRSSRTALARCDPRQPHRRSAVLRHALRTALVAIPGFAAVLIWPAPYLHWFNITRS